MMNIYTHSYNDAPPARLVAHALNAHPVERDTAILPTQAMEDFVNILRDWIDSRLTGGIVWGHQRVGKSQAIRYVMSNGFQLLGAPIPMTWFSAWDPTHSSLTENRFFGEVLDALGFATPRGGTAAIKRRRLIDLIADRVREADEYRFLLFIDEAQWLAEVQLRYLMDVHNQLKMKDIRLVCILVGQPELMSIRSELRNAKKNHLLGRFMSGTHHFQGVCSQSDLQRIAMAFDSQSEYPAGSGISYTQHYVPVAFESGWRLSAQVPLMWSTLDRVLEAERLPTCSEFPMQALMALIVWLLHVLGDEDGPSMQLTQPTLEEGIYRYALSQIVDHLAMVKAA